MGNSSDGLLYYGIPVELDSYDDDEEEIDWLRNIYEKATGDKDADYSKVSDYHKGGLCEILYYGYEYGSNAIAAKASIVNAWEYREVEIPQFLEIKPEWDREIKHFCAFAGVPFTQPKWYLASRWG